MRKILIGLMIFTAVLVMASGASALTDYSDVMKISGGSITVNQWSSAMLSFQKAVPTGMYFTKAFLTLTGSATVSNLFPAAIIGITAGNTNNILYAGSLIFNDGTAKLALNVAALNNYIRATHGLVDLKITSILGDVTITKAKLSGSLAPEPVTMALMGAGIVALPFARRLRRSLRKEA